MKILYLIIKISTRWGFTLLLIGLSDLKSFSCIEAFLLYCRYCYLLMLVLGLKWKLLNSSTFVRYLNIFIIYLLWLIEVFYYRNCFDHSYQFGNSGSWNAKNHGCPYPPWHVQRQQASSEDKEKFEKQILDWDLSGINQVTIVNITFMKKIN